MRRFSALFLSLSLSACGGGDPRPCDPLASAPAQPTALASLIGAGAHADGTIYVLDKAGNDHRVFVGSGLEVGRKRVAGSSEFAVTDGRAVTVAVTEAEPPFRLKVEMTSAGTRMGVLRGMTMARDFEVGQQGDLLAPLPAADLQALMLRDLGGAVFVEYAALVADGRRLVVIRPQDDWGYEDFRLFLGPDDGLVQRKVDSVTRARDGGTTTIRFQLEGDAAEAFFPSSLNPGEPATLKHGGQTFTLQIQRGSAPAGLAFLCR
jgi:hypothetical protein